MRSPRLSGAFVAIAVAAAPLPVLANWKEDLAAQMRWDHDCMVDFYSNVIERMVDDRTLIIAKVHCADGRVFDASQRHEFADFEVAECTPTEQAC